MQHSHTFTLSCHILYVFTLVSCLVFTSRVQLFLVSQHFLLWHSFRNQQGPQETSVRLLPLFLWHLYLLCLGFSSLVYLVLPCSVFYVFTLFWIYICFQQQLFAAVCSGGQQPDYIPTTLLGLVLLADLQCRVEIRLFCLSGHFWC